MKIKIDKLMKYYYLLSLSGQYFIALLLYNIILYIHFYSIFYNIYIRIMYLKQLIPSIFRTEEMSLVCPLKYYQFSQRNTFLDPRINIFTSLSQTP